MLPSGDARFLVTGDVQCVAPQNLPALPTLPWQLNRSSPYPEVCKGTLSPQFCLFVCVSVVDGFHNSCRSLVFIGSVEEIAKPLLP